MVNRHTILILVILLLLYYLFTGGMDLRGLTFFGSRPCAPGFRFVNPVGRDVCECWNVRVPNEFYEVTCP